MKAVVREHIASGKCIECGDPIDIITKHYSDGTTLTLRRSCACMRKSDQLARRAIFRAKADLIF